MGSVEINMVGEKPKNLLVQYERHRTSKDRNMLFQDLVARQLQTRQVGTVLTHM